MIEPTTTTNTVPATKGRTLAVDVTGPAGGRTVLFLHSAPGSRRFDPDPAVTAAAGIRLITFDRAGYGGSTALAGSEVPSITGHAADAVAVLDALEVDAVDVVGWSAGGRIGAALAAGRPDLVASLAIVGTPAPDDQVPWVPAEHRPMLAHLRSEPVTATSALVEAFGGLIEAIAADDDVAASQVTEGAADTVLMEERPEVRRAVVDTVRFGCGEGAAGMAADIVADQVVPWGFDPGSITAPTTCWYGADDGIISPAHGDWWSEQIPGAELTVVADIGHLAVVTAWADILAARPS